MPQSPLMPARAEAMFAKLMSISEDISLPDVLAGEFDDIAGVLAGNDLIRITGIGPYQRWIPRVSRFSFRLGAVSPGKLDPARANLSK